MNILTISEAEWGAAEIYFNNNKDKVKMSRKLENTIKNSFICVNGVIYAKGTGKVALLGEGSFGKVKVCQNKKGENFAVKIEGRGLRAQDNTEKVVMEILNFMHGQAEVPYNKKKYKGRKTEKKLYTILELVPGKELKELIYTDKVQFTNAQKLVLAIQACEAIQKLHEKNILHEDIKPANFMANITQTGKTADAILLVTAIDFGFSELLDKNKSTLKSTWKGSRFYMAPELSDLYSHSGGLPFSFASDIYALGMMFDEDLKLDMDDAFYKKILHLNPKERHTIVQLLDDLYKKLSLEPHLSDEYKNLIKNYEKKRKPQRVAEKKKQDTIDKNKKTLFNKLQNGKLADLLLDSSFNINQFDDLVIKYFIQQDDANSIKKILTHAQFKANENIIQLMATSTPTIQRLLKNNLLKGKPDAFFNKNINKAIHLNHVAATKVLLDAAFYEAKHYKKMISYVIEQEHYDMLDLFITEGYTEVLDLAIKLKNKRVVQYLLDKGMQPLEDHLKLAVKKEHLTIADKLLSHPDINLTVNSIFMNALLNPNFALVDYLIEQKNNKVIDHDLFTNLRVVIDVGMNPIEEAIKGNHLTTMQFLFDNGIVFERMHMEMAIHSGHLDMVEFLVDNGVALVKSDIIDAVNLGHIDIAESIGFIYAIDNDDADLIQYLIDNDAEPGYDEFKLAVDAGNKNMANYFYDYFAQEGLIIPCLETAIDEKDDALENYIRKKKKNTANPTRPSAVRPSQSTQSQSASQTQSSSLSQSASQTQSSRSTQSSSQSKSALRITRPKNNK